MASALKSLEREVHDHEQFLDALVAAATTAKALADQLTDLNAQLGEESASQKPKAMKEAERLKSEREKVIQSYLVAVKNFVALQGRMAHMQQGLIKLLEEFQAITNRVAALPGKVEQAGQRVQELQASLQQTGIGGSPS